MNKKIIFIPENIAKALHEEKLFHEKEPDSSKYTRRIYVSKDEKQKIFSAHIKEHPDSYLTKTLKKMGY